MPDFEARGATLRYELSGGQGPTIAFLNGIAMSIGHWKPVIAEMGQGWRFLCHDFRGQTLSGKPRDGYSLKGHADDLAALLDSLGIEEVHAVGTSYGAEVAMEFAIAHPDRCASLVSIDGVSELDPLLRAAVDSWMASAARDPRVFYKTILPWNYSESYIAANRAALAAREDAVASLPPEWFDAFVRLCEAFLAIDLTPRLGVIRCPLLVMVGEKDILKGLKFASIIASAVPGARLEVIPEAGHAAAIEKPAYIAHSVSRFLLGGVR